MRPFARPFLPFAALTLAAGALSAQRGPARPIALQAMPDLRIDAIKERVPDVALVAVGPDGRIVVAPAYGQMGIVGFDSTGKRFPWKVATGNSDSVEIRSATAIGWQWPNMFVIDPSYKQFSVIGPQGKVLKSIEYPSWVRPAWADRRKFPVFARMDALGMYPDGSMLVLPRSDTSPLDTPEYDTKSTYFVRITAAGTIQRTIAKIPLEAGSSFQGRGGNMRERGGRGMMMDVSTSTPDRLWAASTNGSRVVVVSAPTTGRDSGMIRVTTLSDHGDTVFSRTYPYTPVKVSQKTVDSALARARRGGAGNAELNALKGTNPVANVHVGRDQTVWLTLHETDQGKPYLALDAHGEPLGTVIMPPSFTLQEADHDHIWGIERDGRTVGATAIVRYRLVAKRL